MGLQWRYRAALGRLEALLRSLPLTPPTRPCPELDCIRDRLEPRAVEAIERRALELGVGAERVAIVGGAVSEEDYVRAFASSLGLPFEPLDAIGRVQCPLDDNRLLDAAAAGVIPLRIDGDLIFAVAPRSHTARLMAKRGGPDPNIPGRMRLTTAERIDNFARRHANDALDHRAVEALRSARPDLSAGPSQRKRPFVALAIVALAALTTSAVAPSFSLLAFEIVLALVFLAWMLLRVTGALVRPQTRRVTRPIGDADLPTYTVLVSLYREVAAIPGLVRALQDLDYPPEKLDIKFVTEPDDADTRAAIAAFDLGAPFEVFVAPTAGPRTKPKALNAALTFARGSFTVIYDAEDRPQPDQLRRALEAFQHGGSDLACIQASLTIDNAADNWLTGFFAAEYAGHFDVFLPALAVFEQPLPLGGSSNHFRTSVLREVGAWDPYNVTEDADLGLRLARFGYRTSAIQSCTYEEAPARFIAWLKQRTRWFKGWMQTWLVHMREPLRLRREIGTAGFVTTQLIVGGNVLAALVHPLLLCVVAVSFIDDTPIWATTGSAALFAVSLAAGYVASAFLCLVGLTRRGLMRHAWVLLLMPLYWIMLALAAWRALYQLIRDPYRWEKTEHGLARTTRTLGLTMPAGRVGGPP